MTAICQELIKANSQASPRYDVPSLLWQTRLLECGPISVSEIYWHLQPLGGSYHKPSVKSQQRLEDVGINMDVCRN